MIGNRYGYLSVDRLPANLDPDVRASRILECRVSARSADLLR